MARQFIHPLQAGTMGGRDSSGPLYVIFHLIRQCCRNRWAAGVTSLLLLLVIAVLYWPVKTPPLPNSPCPVEAAHNKPIFWLYHKNEEPLAHVISVFNRIGYSQGAMRDSWDVLWSYKYPYTLLPQNLWPELKPHQKINHFPATACFTFKPSLATKEFSFIPKAFKLPSQAEEFREAVRERPEQLWVRKSNDHRRIHIIKGADSINLKSEGSFVQEFISNPLLIDGRKFDIGVYTVITSVDPLRVYTYSEEVLVRFCSEDYEPFEIGRVKKYVVDDEYTRPSALKSMAELLNQHSLSNKEALNTLIKRAGFSPTDMWSQVDNVIREVLLHCESSMIKQIKKLSLKTRNLFELVRFDFVIDTALKVWLMEVNLSPNLSSEHFSENRLMYEQVIFNTLHLVGLVRPDNLRYNGQYESVMTVNDRDVQVPLDVCINGDCSSCDELDICGLCHHCRTPEDTFGLKTAFLEHVSKRGFSRVYPSESHDNKDVSHANQLMSRWYFEKCQIEQSWCS